MAVSYKLHKYYEFLNIILEENANLFLGKAYSNPKKGKTL
jgi:hypothetical protein